MIKLIFSSQCLCKRLKQGSQTPGLNFEIPGLMHITSNTLKSTLEALTGPLLKMVTYSYLQYALGMHDMEVMGLLSISNICLTSLANAHRDIGLPAFHYSTNAQ
uniref:Uncharacterized protein n=1 Tax=Anguilla anguilla TaxID=7936 RepID=A0A0E9WBE1_ANGAN